MVLYLYRRRGRRSQTNSYTGWAIWSDSCVAGDLSIVVDDATNIAAGQYIYIGSEVLLVSDSTTTANTLVVTRGEAGTTAAVINDDDSVYFVPQAANYGALTPGAHPDILSSVAETVQADYNSFER